jgi:putative peptidoglycan lipid II flippase
MLVRRRLRGEAPGQAVTIPRETVARGLWQLGSVALLGVAPLIERSLAALVAPGGVTMLEYASKLFYIAATVFDTNFAAVFIRGWAVEARERRWTALQRDLRRWVGAVAVGATIIAVALIVVRTPVVHVVLARGQFGSNDIGRVAPLFAILLLAYPFAAIAMLLSGLVVALHETRLLFQVSVLKMVVRSVAALVLGLHWGLAGIAAALLCTHVAECAYLAAAGRRTIRARLAGASVLPTEEE